MPSKLVNDSGFKLVRALFFAGLILLSVGVIVGYFLFR